MQNKGKIWTQLQKTAQNFLSNYKYCDAISQKGRIIKFSLLMQNYLHDNETKLQYICWKNYYIINNAAMLYL